MRFTATIFVACLTALTVNAAPALEPALEKRADPSLIKKLTPGRISFLCELHDEAVYYDKYRTQVFVVNNKEEAKGRSRMLIGFNVPMDIPDKATCHLVLQLQELKGHGQLWNVKGKPIVHVYERFNGFNPETANWKTFPPMQADGPDGRLIHTWNFEDDTPTTVETKAFDCQKGPMNFEFGSEQGYLFWGEHDNGTGASDTERNGIHLEVRPV